MHNAVAQRLRVWGSREPGETAPRQRTCKVAGPLGRLVQPALMLPSNDALLCVECCVGIQTLTESRMGSFLTELLLACVWDAPFFELGAT